MCDIHTTQCCVFQMVNRHDVLYVPHTTQCCMFQMLNHDPALCSRLHVLTGNKADLSDVVDQLVTASQGGEDTHCLPCHQSVCAEGRTGTDEDRLRQADGNSDIPVTMDIHGHRFCQQHSSSNSGHVHRYQHPGPRSPACLNGWGHVHHDSASHTGRGHIHHDSASHTGWGHMHHDSASHTVVSNAQDTAAAPQPLLDMVTGHGGHSVPLLDMVTGHGGHSVPRPDMRHVGHNIPWPDMITGHGGHSIPRVEGRRDAGNTLYCELSDYCTTNSKHGYENYAFSGSEFYSKQTDVLDTDGFCDIEPVPGGHLNDVTVMAHGARAIPTVIKRHPDIPGVQLKKTTTRYSSSQAETSPEDVWVTYYHPAQEGEGGDCGRSSVVPSPPGAVSRQKVSGSISAGIEKVSVIYTCWYEGG